MGGRTLSASSVARRDMVDGAVSLLGDRVDPDAILATMLASGSTPLEASHQLWISGDPGCRDLSERLCFALLDENARISRNKWIASTPLGGLLAKMGNLDSDFKETRFGCFCERQTVWGVSGGGYWRRLPVVLDPHEREAMDFTGPDQTERLVRAFAENGWTILQGNDYKLPDREKYYDWQVVRLRQTNHRNHGKCIATTFAVRRVVVEPVKAAPGDGP